MEIMNGRPADLTNRQDKEIRTYDLLDELGVSYLRVDHEPLMTMEACAAVDSVFDNTVCKNLLLCNRQKTEFYLLMMPGDKKFKTKELSKYLNISRLSFAEGEYMEKFLDITPGSLSVMGLMNDKENCVKLLIDRDVLAGEYVGVHPCINTSTLRFRTADLTEKILPAVKHTYTEVVLTGEE